MNFLKKKKKQHSGKTIKSQFDRHHIFYIRKEWSRGPLDELRLHPYCMVPIHRDTLHRFLHTHLACIPAPRMSSAKEALFHLQYLEDYGAIGPDDCIEKRLEVLIALFRYVEEPTAEALKKQLELVYEFNRKAPH